MGELSILKTELLQCCQRFVEQRIDNARKAIADLQSSANEETKSSAGDKYETGRSMIHLEIEKLTAQINESRKLKQVIDQIQPVERPEMVGLGSLVETDNGHFFISISAGECKVAGNTYQLVSATSPLALAIKGMKAGDVISFRNRSFKILSVH